MLVLVISCKKDNDESGPTIVFNTPQENQTFNVFDPVIVNATISDENKITAVSIALLDNQRNQVHASLAVPVASSPRFTLNTAYYLDNIHLETGTYFIQITASDGKNDSRKVQQIFVVAAPKVLRKVYVITTPSSSSTIINYLDTATNTLQSYQTFSGDYLASDANSYFQYFYKCGNYTGSFSGIDLTYDLPKFHYNATVSSVPYFTGFYPTEKTNYVSLYSGYIRGYDYTGNLVFGANAVSGFFPKKTIKNSGYFISEQKDYSTSANILVTYYATGAKQQQQILLQDVVAMYEKDYGNVFLFGNNAGQGVIQLFDRTNNSIWNPYPFALATGNILSVAQINPNVYLIAHSNGSIYKYQYNTSSVTPYLTGYTALELKYDDINNTIYIVESNSITIINYSSASVVNTINSAIPIKGINLLYNK
jgi:hypothetical protein